MSGVCRWKSRRCIAVLLALLMTLAGCARRAELTYRRAEMFFAQGEHRLAAAEYLKVADNYPQSEIADDALYKLGYMLRAHLEDSRAALAAYTRLASSYPSSPYADDALLWCVHIYARDLRQPAQAAQAAAALDDLAPQLKSLRARAHLEVARAYLAAGNLALARAEAEGVIKEFSDQTEPAAGALLLIAEVEQRQKAKPERIDELLERIAKKYPDTIAGREAQRRLGMLYYARGQETAKQQRELLKRQARWIPDVPAIREHVDERLTMVEAIRALLASAGTGIDLATAAALTGLALVPDAPLPGHARLKWQEDPVAHALEACGFAASIVMAHSREEAWDAARLAVLRNQPALVAYSSRQPWVVIAGWRPLEGLAGIVAPGGSTVRPVKADAFMRGWRPAAEAADYLRFPSGAHYVAAVGGRREQLGPQAIRDLARKRLLAAIENLPSDRRPAAVALEAKAHLETAVQDEARREELVAWAQARLSAWAEVRRVLADFLAADDSRLAHDARHIADVVGALRVAIMSARAGETGRRDWEAAASLAGQLAAEEDNFQAALKEFLTARGEG
ncbi:MAG: tetratricopeptide repeat protein [Armatimonadetes bacterium]|nr:tetratricopeptide repeat protein [Armatimonadota bacterium]